MKKKLITLVREMEMETEGQYFEYLIESYINGNFSQCRRLFEEMKRTDQKDFITYLNNAEDVTKIRNFYFELL